MKKIILITTWLIFQSSSAFSPGIHLFKVQFGAGPVFNDIIFVDKSGKASFTVPGVFSFPITINQEAEKAFEFLLEGKEGDRPFSFRFKGNSQNESYAGKIYEESTGNKIGTFEGEKIHDLQ